MFTSLLVPFIYFCVVFLQLLSWNMRITLWTSDNSTVHLIPIGYLTSWMYLRGLYHLWVKKVSAKVVYSEPVTKRLTRPDVYAFSNAGVRDLGMGERWWETDNITCSHHGLLAITNNKLPLKRRLFLEMEWFTGNYNAFGHNYKEGFGCDSHSVKN